MNQDKITKEQVVKKLISNFKAEVGYTEKKGNNTKYAAEYFPSLQNQAWCDTFVDSMYVKTYGKDTAEKMLGGFSAYTPTSAQFYKNMGRWNEPKGGYIPQVGDQIFFQVKGGQNRINHTGIVTRVDRDKGIVYTIEGNTSAKPGDREGTIVKEKSYSLDDPTIKGYGTPDWDKAINPQQNNNRSQSNPPADQKSAARQWQSDLNHLGYKGANGKPLAVDGVVGPQTKSAIEAFQKDHGLAVDGVVGPKTLKALEEAKVKQQAAPESKKADVSAEQASASPVRSDARLVQLGEQILQRLDDIYRAVSTQKPQFNVQQNLNVAAYWLGRAVKEQFPLNQPCSCVSFETRNNKELMHTFFNQGGVQAAVTADVNKGADTPVEQSLATMQQFSMDQAQAQNIAQQHKAMAA